jgi:uncharacterized protein
MDIIITHQPELHRFISRVADEEALLEYRLLPDHGIEFSRTFVPEELRGKGIAEKLVRSGLAWAREQEYVIQASCWYVKRFLKHSRK